MNCVYVDETAEGGAGLKRRRRFGKEQAALRTKAVWGRGCAR